MQQRKFGRPSGTDGSDFSYRMVVDSRYTRVAKGKSRLYRLILSQVFIHLVGLQYTVFSTPKGQDFDTLDVSSSIFGLISLFIGELGRQWSKVNILRVFILTSSLPILYAVYSAIHSNSISEVIRNPSDWGRNKFAAIEVFLLLLGSLLQIFTIITTTSLIGNMSPPKKAS